MTCFMYEFYLDAVSTSNGDPKLVAKEAIGTALRKWKVRFVISGEIHKYKKVKNITNRLIFTLETQ